MEMLHLTFTFKIADFPWKNTDVSRIQGVCHVFAPPSMGVAPKYTENNLILLFEVHKNTESKSPKLKNNAYIKMCGLQQ